MEPSDRPIITLSLRELAQLFDSMDPSPFGDRDLDSTAEEFIMGSARELSSRQELELVLLLGTPTVTRDAAEVEKAIRCYFARRAAVKRLEFRQLMRRGRLSLAVALIFLAICLCPGEIAAKWNLGTVGDILKEGLTIVGWVAMWRPLEICLYDWWPLYEERGRLDILARLRVKIIAPEIQPLRILTTVPIAKPTLAGTAA